MNPRHALAYWFLGQPLALAGQIFMMIYTARTLGPEEKGLFVAAISALAFLQILQNFGLGAFLVSQVELVSEDISTAFGVLLIGCLIISLATYTVAVPLAHFMRETRLIPIFHVLAIAPLLIPVQMVGIGLMMREHRNSIQLILTIGRVVVTTLVVYIMCERGFGAISMAWSFVAGSATVTALVVLLRPSVLLIKPSLKSWRKIMHFGSSMVALSYLINLLPRLYEILVTRNLGVAATGSFSQMLGLVDPVRSNIQQVVVTALFPTFAEYIRQNLPLGPLYLKLVECLTGVLIPIYVVMAILAPEIIFLLFGAQWLFAANILLIIYFSQIATTLAAGGYEVLLSMGRVKTLLAIEITNFCVSLIVFWVGLHKSLTAALTCLIATAILYSTLYAISLAKTLKFTYQNLMKIYLRTSIVTIAAAVPALCLKNFSVGLKFELHHFFLIGGLSFTCAYFAGKLANHLLVKEVDRLFSNLIGKIWDFRH